MSFPTKLNQLCYPSYVYFIMSMITFVLSAFQNMGNHGIYKLGLFSCRVPSCLMIFAMKLVYVLFWTWILNLMCKDGHKDIAWFFVLFPFILLFVILGFGIQYQHKRERMSNPNSTKKHAYPIA